MIDMEAMGDSHEQHAKLRARFSIQLLPQITDALTPYLPESTLDELVRITDEVTTHVARRLGTDAVQLSVDLPGTPTDSSRPD